MVEKKSGGFEEPLAWKFILFNQQLEQIITDTQIHINAQKLFKNSFNWKLYRAFSE